MIIFAERRDGFGCFFLIHFLLLMDFDGKCVEFGKFSLQVNISQNGDDVP
jgi:hypothetical protein